MGISSVTELINLRKEKLSFKHLSSDVKKTINDICSNNLKQLRTDPTVENPLTIDDPLQPTYSTGIYNPHPITDSTGIDERLQITDSS